MHRSFLLPMSFFILCLGQIACLNAKPVDLDASHAVTGVVLDSSYSAYEASITPQSSIPYSDSWTCAFSTDCQNVYDVNFSQADTLNIAITSVTGTSVARVSVYAPGSALSGTNLLNGTTYDQVCPSASYANQDVDVTTSASIPSAGVYRVAIGRDWGNSAGATGTYHLSLTTSSSIMTGFTKTVSDTATLSSGMSCP